MKIKILILLCLISVSLHAWEGEFALSENAQKRADFYNKFLQVLFLKDNNQPLEAAALLKELMVQSPEDKTIIQEYCYLALNSLEKEFSFCKEQLQNIKNKTWQNYTLLGDYYLREGALTNALGEYEKALNDNPENLDLAFHYANILSSKNQKKAIEYLQSISQNFPQADAFISLKIAEIYLKNKEEEKAISTLNDTLKYTKNKKEIYSALIKIYQAKKDDKNLYKVYQDMQQDGLADIQVLEMLAHFALLNNDEKKVQEYFMALINLDETNVYALRYFVLKEEQEGRYENALNYLKKIKDFDNNPSLQVKAGYYLSMLSNKDELLALMENAYKKFDDNQEIAYFYALSLIDAKEYNKAEKVFEKILKNSPENELVLFNYATLLYERKKYSKMEELLRKLLKVNPNNAEALNFLGYFLIDNDNKKNLEEGRDFVMRALKLSPKEIAYLDSLAWYYFKAGQYDEAQKIFSSLPEVEDEEIYLHKAELYFVLKDFENAIRHYENVLKMNSENKKAKKGLKRAKAESLKKY